MKTIYSERHQRLLAALIAARKASQLTQAQVASRLGKPQSFVAKVEGGERRLDVIEFLELAETIGADPHAILRQLGA